MVTPTESNFWIENNTEEQRFQKISEEWSVIGPQEGSSCGWGNNCQETKEISVQLMVQQRREEMKTKDAQNFFLEGNGNKHNRS